MVEPDHRRQRHILELPLGIDSTSGLSTRAVHYPLPTIHGPRSIFNAAPAFMQHTQVANGASDILIDVFGEAGTHARLAVGVSSLPANIALEIEAIIELK